MNNSIQKFVFIGEAMRFLLFSIVIVNFCSVLARPIDPLKFNPSFYLCNTTKKPVYYAVCYEQDDCQPVMKKIMPGHWAMRTDINTEKPIFLLVSSNKCPEKGDRVDQLFIEPNCCKKINLDICPIDSTIFRSEPGTICMRDYMVCLCTQDQGDEQMCIKRCGKQCYLLPGNVVTQDMSAGSVEYNPAPCSVMCPKRKRELTNKDIEKLERELITVKYLMKKAHTSEDMPESNRLEKELMYIRYLLKERYPDLVVGCDQE